MHEIIIQFPLQPTPRERVARNGGRYKPKDYGIYTINLIKEFQIQLSYLREAIDYPYYVGLFNGYIPRYQYSDPSDIDNIEKGILDSLVKAGKLRNDNRTNYIGIKKRCVATQQHLNVLLIGSELEETTIDNRILQLRTLAKIKQIHTIIKPPVVTGG